MLGYGHVEAACSCRVMQTLSKYVCYFSRLRAGCISASGTESKLISSANVACLPLCVLKELVICCIMWCFPYIEIYAVNACLAAVLHLKRYHSSAS